MKKIKLYTHHKKFLKVTTSTKDEGFFLFNLFYKVGLWLIGSFKFLIKNFFKVCFETGSALISISRKTFLGFVNDIRFTKESFPKRIRKFREGKFNYGVFVFLLISLLAWGGISSLHLVAKGLELKGKVLGAVTLGNSFLSSAKDNISKQDLQSAQNSFSRAYLTFNQGQKDVQESGQLLNSLLAVLPQKQAADSLLESASLVSSAGQDLLSLDSYFKNLSFGANGITTKQGATAETFDAISNFIEKASVKISRASKLVSGVKAESLPKQNQQQFVDLNNQLQNGNIALQNLEEIFSLFKNLLMGQKTFLVLFENNNELRPSGGFLGTYGAYKVKDGNITNVKISSIYDLDGQLTTAIKPPQPLLNLGPTWHMRDSNWFADFPETAKKISDFYEIEAGETPDVVIVLTPNLIEDLLKITGPINLPLYGVTLNSNNFVELTQVVTTMSNDLPTNSPKQMLADLFPLLLQKISTLSSENLPEVILSLQKQLNEKQIAIYSRDEELQKQLADFHWTGDLEKSDRDYLNIISSNLGGTKTDLSIDQNVELTSTISEKGVVTNELTITRKNNLPNLSETHNLSYLRILVPLGSKLISNSGFDVKTLNFPEDQKYKIDDDVLAWEKNSVTDNLSQTRIGQEAGKTFFGNWLEVSGGQTKTVKITYELPFTVSSVDRFSLLLQKQLGAKASGFKWNLKFSGREVVWNNFDPATLNLSDLSSEVLLDKDYFLGLVLQKRK